jgi:hypothetical protein
VCVCFTTILGVLNCCKLCVDGSVFVALLDFYPLWIVVGVASSYYYDKLGNYDAQQTLSFVV